MQCPQCHLENPDASQYCSNCAALLTPEGRAFESLETVDSPAGIISAGTVIAGKYRVEARINDGMTGATLSVLSKAG